MCCNALKSIYHFMSSAVRDGMFLPFVIPEIGQLPHIQLCTRYFSKRHTEGFDDRIISSEIDPHGVLQNILSRGKVRYTTDNVVRYRCEIEVDEGGVRYGINYTGSII